MGYPLSVAVLYRNCGTERPCLAPECARGLGESCHAQLAKVKRVGEQGQRATPDTRGRKGNFATPSNMRGARRL